MTSRRSFLKIAATALAAERPAFASPQHDSPESPSHPILAYVGTYSSPQGAEGSPGRGQGIYLFRMDPATGTLDQGDVFPNDSNPSCLAFDQAGTHLYSANETGTYGGRATGSLTAYSVDRSSGRLTLLNTLSSEAAGPTYLSVHPSGKYVLVANYEGGTVSVFSLRSNGEIGAATAVREDKGQVGSTHAASANPGSFAISGHERSHAHIIQSDPSGRYVLAADLGLDRIFIWKFDVQHGTLTPNDPPSAALPSGDGPRHFAFHPNGRWLYSLQEESSTLVLFDYDGARGRLLPRQTISSLPQGFTGTSFGSEVRVSPDGKFVYAANRLHDSIAWFPIGADGALKFGGEEWTRGDYPRSFSIDPTGNFAFSCNQRADNITAFRIDRDTGGLVFTGRYTPVGTPSIITFLA